MAIDNYDPSQWRGFYAPFRVPFPVSVVPDAMPGEAPLISLCFNEFWLPYIQGALKALAREETYRGPVDCVQAWVQGGMDLLLTEPIATCGGESPLDWYSVFGITVGGQTFFGSPNNDAGVYGLGWDSGVHVFHSSGMLNPHGYVAFRDLDGNPCGVHVRRFAVWGGGLGGVLTLTDCLDHETASSVLDAYDSHGDFPSGVDLKKIDFLAGTSEGGIYFVADGPIVCGVS